MDSKRVEKAIELFREGYNCSQAVVVAYSDLCGLTQEQAQNISAPFGGGLGRLRHVCGAVSGMCMVAGMVKPFDLQDKNGSRKDIYELTQKMCADFKDAHGSIICSELLGERAGAKSATPEDRTPYYYATRPCEKCVECAARIVESIL